MRRTLADTVTTTRAAIAHVLRRTTFGPHPGQVVSLAGDGDPDNVKAAIDQVLSAAVPNVGFPTANLDDPQGRLVGWWLDVMARPTSGIHEKLTWFWHGHFTSGFDKVYEASAMLRQHMLLRRLALGNFRTLVHEITKDPAMLQYLDGDPSTAESPNENYARELMELFTLGRGTFSEDDVRAAAKALAGWDIDENGNAVFNPEHAFGGPLQFLSRSGTFNADDICDIVCDHPACPPFIAGKLHRYLVGVDPSATRRAALANIFRNSNLEIRPLVEAILREPSFLAPENRYRRARYPVEWWSAARAALNVNPTEWWSFSQLDQVPFHPPNVAGWPDATRFLGPGPSLVRASLARELARATEPITAPDVIGAVLERLSIFDASATTRRALDEAARTTAEIAPDDPNARTATLTALALCSPEFVLA